MKTTMKLFFVAIISSGITAGIFNFTRHEKEISGYAEPAPGKNVSNSNPGSAISGTSVQFTNAAATPENTIDFTPAAEKTVNAVVHVKSVFQDQSQYYNSFYDYFFGYRPFSPQPTIQAGSGIIISNNGYIVTNNHVIENAGDIEVTLNDKRVYKAKVIGADKTTDLALLKIEEAGLPNIQYGNSDNVKVGQWVLAVGNPFNLTSTVTAGIVSAKGRDINIIPDQFKIESFIQTDAAVNPGNSGGALVSSTGELVGVNTAIASNTGSYTGYSFAIPVNVVKKVVADLMEYGTVQRAYMGISIRNIDSKLADEIGQKMPTGVYVSGLTENGAAGEAGIKEGDVITKINGNDITNVSVLQEQVAQHRPGERIEVAIISRGEEKIIPVVLRNKEGTTGIVEAPRKENIVLLGASFAPASDADKKKLNLDCGIQVEELKGGKLLSAGIREGFIITKIDKKKIYSTEDITTALENKKGGILIEGVYPNGMKGYYGFGL